jgi:two-component system, NarL family, nitrate/nitrite response regulator NarL
MVTPPERGERVRVVVADDHPLFRSALVDAVKRRPELELIGVAADGKQALTAVQDLGPDVIVLDIRMPGLDGGQVLNAIVRDSLGTRVLFLATSTDSRAVYELIARGAGGYLDKGVPAEKICESISAVARGRTVLSETVEDGVLEQIRDRAVQGGSDELSPRESEVLRMIADGLSAPEIGKRLYIEPSTVKTHLKNLYQKLGVSDRAAAVAEGMRRGLLE